MTSMVQTDLGPAPSSSTSTTTAAKYKDSPIEDSSLRHSVLHAPQHPHFQHPRSAGLLQHQKYHPSSSRQPTTSIPPGPYASQQLANGLPHTTYGQSPQESPYYASHPTYTAAGSAPAQYSSSGPPDIMTTAAQMQRPYPPIYHTPQSSSPASVASQSHDHHNRNIYSQSPQMASHIYGYQPYSSMNPVQPSPYAAHPSPQPHSLTSQPLMMPPHQPAATQIPHQPSTVAMSSPTIATHQPTPTQRAVLGSPHPATSGAPVPTASIHRQSPGVGTSSSAAPGPIPATTPLVVRQDGNGVQWIAFEYSRDRVKMEYTIRCDVESVNVDNLSNEFKGANCVYPRACIKKDEYKGNRLVYETECNAVGWALAELNPALRGKRGLIQRAVDSWRNSNQDPKLRSRRVKRMAKITRRQHTAPVQAPAHMAAGSPISPGMSLPAAMTAPVPRPGVGPLTMGPPLHHHHHVYPDGSPTHEEVSGTAEYTNASHHPTATEAQRPLGQTAGTEIRPAQVFHGYQTFPPPAKSSTRGPAMPPILRESGLGAGALGRPPTVATSSKRSRADEVEEVDDECPPSNDALFGPLPEGKRRKFILVDDTQKGCRVRVKVMLDAVNMDEIPDSYRMDYSVYPRTYFPVQMKNPPGLVTPGKRYFRDDTTARGDDEAAVVGRTTVPTPSIDGERESTVPKMSRKRHRKDVMLNDLSYRMSWSQSRVFAGRKMFLQRSLDSYRNKTRSTMLAAGRNPLSIPAHFETRAGKRQFLERGKRKVMMGRVDAARRSAEEVEG